MLLRYLLRRGLWGAFTLFVFITVVFFLVHSLTPGDFVSQLVFQLSRDDRVALQHELGLDLPIWQRYIRWLSDLVKLDLGMSYRGYYYGNLPVKRIVLDALPYSLLFLIVGLGAAVLIGYHVGKWSGWRGPGIRTELTTFAALALYSSFPPWIAYLVVIALIPRLRGFVKVFPGSISHWLYTVGYSISSFGERYTANPVVLAAYVAISLVLGTLSLVALNALLKRRLGRGVPYRFGIPILILGIIGVWSVAGISQSSLTLLRFSSLPIATFILVTFAEFMLIMVVSMSHSRRENYIDLAIAKGLPEKVVRDSHAARNAVLPFLAKLVVTIPYMLTGMVIIEGMFGWPGLGYQLGLSRGQSDIPAMMGILIFIGFVSLLARLALEVTQYALDPRLSFRQSSSGSSYREQSAAQLIDLQTSMTSLLAGPALGRQLQRFKSGLARAKGSWRIFSRNPLALIGLGLLTLFMLMAIAHPVLIATTVWPSGIYDPVTAFDTSISHPSMPSSSHLLGTTITGLDILSMFLSATGHSFIIGLSAGIVGALIGTGLGAAAAYFGGRTDTILSQVSDIFLLLPPPIFMAVVGGLYQEAGPLVLGITYGLIAGLGSIAIVMRTHALTIVSRPFIEAAHAAGGSVWHILSKHIVPHMVAMAFLQMLLAVVGAVIMDGYLSFSSATRYVLNWGTMLAQSELLQDVLGEGTQWFSVFPPVLAFTLFGLAFYLVSRGVYEVADPKLRQV